MKQTTKKAKVPNYQVGDPPGQKKRSSKKEINTFPRYPLHTVSEDNDTNYSEEDLHPEIITLSKVHAVESGKINEKDGKNDMIGSDVDLSGSVLSNEQENYGNEDEENNYCSLGRTTYNDIYEHQAD